MPRRYRAEVHERNDSIICICHARLGLAGDDGAANAPEPGQGVPDFHETAFDHSGVVRASDGGQGETRRSFVPAINAHGVPERVLDYATTVTADDAIARMEVMPEPWLLVVSFNAAHAPHLPEEVVR